MNDLVLTRKGYQELKEVFQQLERKEKMLDMMHEKYHYADHHKHVDYQEATDRYNEAQAHLKAAVRWILDRQIFILPEEVAG